VDLLFSLLATSNRSYLDPLLCMPVLLGLFCKERSVMSGKPYRLPLFEMIVIVVFLSLIFELGFPKWSAAFFYDPFDFVAYGIGAVLFTSFGNSFSSKRKELLL